MLDAGNPDAYIQLGWVYEVQQQWSKARAEYERVSQLVPDLQRNVALRISQLYVNEGNLDAAIQAFLEGIELAPDEPDGYLGLARLYEAQGRPEEAQATYSRMQSRGPNMAALAHQALGTLAERQGDVTRAEEEYRQALALAPEDPSAHLLLAGFYESTAQWDKAIAAYQQAAALDPSQATNALLFTADIQRQHGDRDALQATCRQVVALVDAMASPDYHALRQRGLAFAMQGDFARAEQGLQRALAANPDDFQAHLYLAATLTYLGRPDEADHHLTEGIRLAQRKTDLVYALREAEVLATHEPPVPGAAALLERMQAAHEQLP
jgi:tetratricopeptide (TPR) repeat protein